MAVNDVSKLANISTVGAPPIPDVNLPKLPDRLRQIDPDGCAQYDEDLQKAFGEWVKKQNVLNSNQNQQIQSLVKKG